MAEVYIHSYSKYDDETFDISLETLIVFHVVKICKSTNIKVNVVLLQEKDRTGEPIFQVNRSSIPHEIVLSEGVPDIASYCKWPVVVRGNVVVAGLASVARQIIKSSCEEEALCLLGFREACLMACNESSIWTKFCEVDMISTVKDLFQNPKNYVQSDALHLPADLSRFESHMSEPVRLHNVYKLARIKNNDKLIKSNVPINELNLEHRYGEGPDMTLSDLLLFPCYTIISDIFSIDYLTTRLPLSTLWYKNLCHDLQERKIDFSFPNIFEMPLVNVDVFLEIVAKQSLYIADPKRYKPQNRIFTRQSDIERALAATADLLDKTNNEKPFGYDTNFSWKEVPLDASPLGGALPETRASRKCQQLENLAKAVVKISNNQCHTIVDFCSGSGHLGILLATLLPNSHVILVENKERSLQRAHERILKMNLSNVSLVQSNLDYFVAGFDIGMALHACGVATDLVIQTCIKNRAHFVCCPCCYGGIHDCHHLSYPRSEVFKNTSLDYKNYLIIGHSADQTHDKDNVKTAQGYICMNVIDTDRKLQAEECGYSVHLGKLSPPSCTPKNNLLVGICG